MAAFAVPVFFVAAAQLFERAAADEVAAQVVADVPQSGAGLALEANGRLGSGPVAELDQLVRSRFAEVEGLSPPTQTLATATGEARRIDDGESTVIPANTRLLARAGAIAALDLVAVSETFDGVYVSESFAARGSLTVGSTVELTIELIDVTFTVGGIYRDLWPDPPASFRDLPPVLVPQWDPSTGRPTFEAVILDADRLLALDLPGTAYWDAKAAPLPATLSALEAAVVSYATVEFDVARDDRFLSASRAVAGLSGRAPSVSSGLPDALDDTRTALRSIDGPLASAQAAGVVLGGFVVAANAVFLAVGRRRMWQVLVTDGDGAIRVGSLAAAQSVVPALTGTVLGVAAAGPAARLTVAGTTPMWSALRFGPIAAVAGVAVVVAAVVTALVTTATPTEHRDRSIDGEFQIVAPVVVLAIAAWVQVGSETFQRSISPSIVFAPIVVLAAVAMVAVVAIRRLLLFVGQRSAPRSVAIRFGLRRLIGSATAGMALAAALSVSVGLTVFSATMEQTRATSVEAKATTRVGSVSSASLVDDVPGRVPSRSSVVGRSIVFVTPGSESVEVVAIDGDTFGDAIEWPAAFGELEPDEIVARLERRPDAPIPAIGLSSRPMPAEGVFGVGNDLAYELVGEVDAAPLAPGTRPMLLVRADALEGAAQEQFVAAFAAEFGGPPSDADVTERYRSPLDGYRLTLISDLPVDELEQVAVATGLPAYDLVDRVDITGAPAERVVRWSFHYLQIVGGVCLAVTLLSAFLYARLRASSRAAALRVGHMLGLSPSTARRAAVVEFGLLAMAALVPAVVGSIAVAWRVAPAFERGPFPPAMQLELPVTQIVGLVVVSAVVVLVAGLVAESSSVGGGVDDHAG